MRAPQTISLGAQDWLVRPLTLAQVREIDPILMANASEGAGTVAAAIAIVAIALSRDHPQAAQNLAEIEASAQEIGAAMAAVLRLGGFIPQEAGDGPPGEAQAGGA